MTHYVLSLLVKPYAEFRVVDSLAMTVPLLMLYAIICAIRKRAERRSRAIEKANAKAYGTGWAYYRGDPKKDVLADAEVLQAVYWRPTGTTEDLILGPKNLVGQSQVRLTLKPLEKDTTLFLIEARMLREKE